MKFNGTKTRVLTITLAAIYTLAPISQTMAANRDHSDTSDMRNPKRISKSINRENSKSGMSDGEKVVVGVAAFAILFWAISEGTKKPAPRRGFYSDSQRRKDQRRREELQRQRTINEMRYRRGY